MKKATFRNRGRKVLLRHAIRVDYRTFAEIVFVMISGEELSHDTYVEVICQTAMDVFSGKIKRLILNLPPRHGKTLLFTITLIAWVLAHRPKTKIMVLTYDEGLARYIADRVRDVLTADWFTSNFATRLRDGRNRAMDFTTTAGGGLFANQMSSGITGRGADMIIGDDLSDITDAWSPTKLARDGEIFDTAVRSRLNDPRTGIIAVVSQRLHRDDVPGKLIAEGGWTSVVLPFIAEQDEEYAIDGRIWHRRKGELLLAGRFTETEVEAKRRLTNFRAIYQQHPDGAVLWKLAPDDFPLYSTLPPTVDGVVVSIDTAYVPGVRNSWSVAQAWRSAPQEHYLLDQWRDQVYPGELELEVGRFITRHRPSVVLVEPANIGLSLVERLAKRGRREGFRVIAVPTANRGKIERFADIVPLIKHRLVHLPCNAIWIGAYIQELVEFPSGSADDQVDTSSQYLGWRLANPTVNPRLPRAVGVVVSTSGRTYPPLSGKGYVFKRKR